MTLILLAGLAGVTGCGDGRSYVMGQITLDGEPLIGGDSRQITIMFYPESGVGAPAAATVDESGTYKLSSGSQNGLAPGDYVVTLSAMELTFPNGPNAEPSRKLLTPLRYTQPKASGLRREVKPGSNRFDLELTSKPE